ncbi:MAG TPA: sugar phosphate nucleotidyltransferase [Acidobacteriota bacterium]|nr:sugar phosphate nucleotidyltransferase [Acidobacteriota bacterium]
MKGMILAAGLGTRMGPISRYMAKPAVPFLGVPMIERSVEVLMRAGIEEIIVNTHHLPETVHAVLGDGSHKGIKISYSHEDPILGTGGGIGKVRTFFGEETFVVINSDVLIGIDARQAIESHKRSGAVTTLALRPDPENRYGKVLLDADGIIRQIEGSPAELADVPADWRADLMFAGLHVIEPRWFDFAPPREVYDSVRDVYSAMIAAGEKINGFVFQGRWIDIGSARRLLDATSRLLPEQGGNIIPDPGAVEGSAAERCVLHEGVRVGRNCRLRDVVFLGEADVGENCNLDSSIVCPGARIRRDSSVSEAIIAGNEVFKLSDLRD